MIDSKQPVLSTNALLKRILMPYKTNCHYLKKAWVEFRQDSSLTNPSEDLHNNLLLAKGEFSIPESCYIDDTGHFNAVEFNICYNQLGYYLLAECIQRQLLNNFLDWDIEEYVKRQLSNILIVKLSSSFHRLMCSDKFNGYVEIKKISKKENTLFIQTVCGFEDTVGGYSTGKVLLAIV